MPALCTLCLPHLVIKNIYIQCVRVCTHIFIFMTNNRYICFQLNPYEQLLAKDLYNMLAASKLIAFFHANPYDAQEKFKVKI